MNREFNFDLLSLSYNADYFKHYTREGSYLPERVDVYFPGVVSITDCVMFLGFIIPENDTIISLLKILHPKHIFILADYFGVWTVFRDIITLANSPVYGNVTTVFLKYSLEFYGPYHPFTINLFEAVNISKSCFTACVSMPLMSYRKLRKLFYDCARAERYDRQVYDHCYLCNRPVIFINLAVMPLLWNFFTYLLFV
jgi:hypothetical protein